MWSCPVTSVFCLFIDDRISDQGFSVSTLSVEFSDILSGLLMKLKKISSKFTTIKSLPVKELEK
jgi:hypothetical protein